jgi:hypothetical protein
MCNPEDDGPIDCPEGQVLENNECVDRPLCEDIPHFNDLCDGGCGVTETSTGEEIPHCTGC